MLTTTFIPVIVIAVLVACAIILNDSRAKEINAALEIVDGEVVDVVEIIDAFDPDDVYVLNAEDNLGPEDEDPYAVSYSTTAK